MFLTNLAIILSAGIISDIKCVDNPIRIYVSTTGNDTNSGMEDQPLATINAAQQKVRTLIHAGLDRDITVLLRQGTYELAEPIIFGPQDSGTRRYSITYAAYPKDDMSSETVILSGGRKINNFKPLKQGLCVAKLPESKEQWWFEQLYSQDKLLTRARYPNDTYLRIAKVSVDLRQIEFDQALPKFPVTTANSQLVVFGQWSIVRGMIDLSENNSVKTETVMGCVGMNKHCLTAPKKPAYLEHAKEFIDRPGEWFLDKDRGELFYQADANEMVENITLIAPRLEQLLIIKGQKDKPVENIHFKGITFAYAGWKLPKTGFAGIQAGHYGTIYKEEPTRAIPLTIELQYAANCGFEFCAIKHLGSSGLGFGAGCRGNTVSGCVVDDIGANGMVIGWRAKEDRPPRKWFENDWADQNDVPVDNEISNCLVHRCGRVDMGAVGILDMFTRGSKIIHNSVTDLPYTGISLGFRWNTTPSSRRECLVAYNHVFNVMQLLADGGGIYSLGFAPDSVIQGNLIHGVGPGINDANNKRLNNGIFFDQGSKGYRVVANMVFDTFAMPIRFNTEESGMSFKNNSFGISDKDPKFPRADAARAGLEPAYRTRVHELDSRLIRYDTPPCAKL